MTTPDVESYLSSWLAATAPRVAPPTLLDRARTRRIEVRQRRWLTYVPIPRMPSLPIILPSAASLAAAVVILVTVSIAALTIGRSPNAAGPAASLMPTSNVVTIEFDIGHDGVVDAEPGADGRGSGTFSVTGALGNEGTYTEVVSVTPEGQYQIERTLVGTHGTMVVIATATTWIEWPSSLKVTGRWRLADGGPAYPGVVAEGPVSGSRSTAANARPTHETWTGEVRR